MFNIFKRRGGNLRDETASDIVTDVHINVSDSAPILSNRSFDLMYGAGAGSNGGGAFGQSSVHDLRRASNDVEVSMVKRSLRTVPGVFCPVALSMCSVAVFMRIGFIVGNAGFLQSIGVYLLAFLIFVLTGLSVCAISTNGAIQGGGVYYMISRALGPEFGGSIGTLFFFANAIGSAFNAAGLVEALLDNVGVSKMSGGLPESHGYKLLYGSCLNVITLVICLLGANLFSYAVAFIYLVMVGVYTAVVLSIFIQGPQDIAMPGIAPNATGRFTGLSATTFSNNLYSNYSTDYTTGKQTNFAYVFGVLFSSLTGIMAGANMSGELKKPAKSIPIGTMSAVAFVFFVYFSENILLAASFDREVLINNNQVLQAICFWGPLVPIGIVATTFSGELSALIGSSRVLKALADDQLFGPLLNFVKNGKTKSGNPWVAVIISFLISECVLFIGSLNLIAPLVTIFYLLAYFGVNLACLALDLASAPNFRPTFKYFSWYTALLGMVGSITMTFIVSVEYASIAIGLLIALITVLYFRDFPPEWGSISQALIFHQVRKYLLLLDTRKDHVKFWRPQILLLIANPRSCWPLIDFGNDVKKGGLFVLGNVKVGDLDNYDDDPCSRELPIWMNLVDNLRVKAFIELTLSQSVKDGIHSLIRISGLGGMKPNTVMLGFYDNNLPEDLLRNRPLLKKRRLLNYGMTSSPNGTLPNSNSLSMVQFEELRNNNDIESRLDMDAYVDIVRDVLKMRKNLCICRGFNNLNKDVIRAKTTPIYIDVWPLNFLIPELCSQLDSTSLFMLQLSCILNMVSVWKRGQVRVFLCTDHPDASENARRKSRLDDLLTQLRINAQTVLVPMENVKNLMNRPLINEADLPHYQQLFSNQDVMSASELYLKAANQLIKQYSEDASMCFLYLPPPAPVRRSHNNNTTTNSLFGPIHLVANESGMSANSTLLQEQADLSIGSQQQHTAFISAGQESAVEDNKKYMRILELLSDQLPPCMFVNGVSCVTSTHL